MFSDIRIYIVVGIFMIVCISLMIFNFVIIHHIQRKNSSSTGIVKRWIKRLYRQAPITSGKKLSTVKYEKFLLRKLAHTENLVAYSQALQYLKDKSPEIYNSYADTKYVVFKKLANIYRRKSSIERTYYAEFIYDFPQVAEEAYGQLVDVLISYIDGSNVYCRTNILRALCSLGSAQGVVRALRTINNNSLFMHNRILTNELSKFKGDKEILAEYLWNECTDWNDNLLVSVIKFVTEFSDRYGNLLFPILQDPSTDTEVRCNIIRYYGTYSHDPAYSILIDFIVNPTNIDLAIEAAAALSLYPSSKTVTTLKDALSSPDWYIRYNASYALIKLGNKADLIEVLETQNEYATEIIAYIFQLRATLQNSNLQKKTDGEKASA